MVKKILIIEDDQSIRELLQDLLQSEGYEVLVAGHGQEALDLLRMGHHPNLILMDLMMPVLDGYGFRQEQLKNTEWSAIPVVAMSAEANAKNKIKAFGVQAFLSKPVDIDVLLSTIAKFCS